MATGCNSADDGDSGAGAESTSVVSTSGAFASAAASGSAVPSASAAPEPTYEPIDLPEAEREDSDLAEQRRAMLRRMRAMGSGSLEQLAELEKIVFASKHIGQGNPAVAKHPLTRTECIARRKAAGFRDEVKPQCGAPFMTPIYDPAKQKEADAKVCIDRYEFPGLPCDYPVTWVTTKEAQQICKALGKRLCDAHEWEGACAGAVHEPDEEYAFNGDRGMMRNLHNRDREIVWAYGPKKDHSKCAMGSRKSKKCGSGWRQCGSNTYPAGSFPECRSFFGVYDQHGNAAEHMALPLRKDQLGRDGGFGVPEMKGSWFIFQSLEAHIDDCRWRAPSWHDNEGKNHSNYHLGFRCCKDIP